MKQLALILALCACSASAGGAPGTPWRHAWAMADCAPWDGAATTVMMSDADDDSATTYPQLRISVYHDLQSVSGARWLFGASQADAMAAVFCRADADCAVATGGWVEFGARESTGSLRGHYEIIMSDGRRLTGSFVAPVRRTTALCG